MVTRVQIKGGVERGFVDRFEVDPKKREIPASRVVGELDKGEVLGESSGGRPKKNELRKGGRKEPSISTLWAKRLAVEGTGKKWSSFFRQGS